MNTALIISWQNCMKSKAVPNKKNRNVLVITLWKHKDHCKSSHSSALLSFSINHTIAVVENSIRNTKRGLLGRVIRIAAVIMNLEVQINISYYHYKHHHKKQMHFTDLEQLPVGNAPFSQSSINTLLRAFVHDWPSRGAIR